MKASPNLPIAETRDSEVVIDIRGLSYSYGGTVALDDVHLTVRRGEFVCVVGPNGGGKTTLLKLMLGLLRTPHGTIHIFGVPPEHARCRIGYMPQHAQLDPQFPVSVMDVVLMGRLGLGQRFGRFTKTDKECVRSALRDVHLADLERRPYASLSGGQRQRVLLARALTCDPPLLLLDEPMANLDTPSQESLHQLFHDLNARMTMVMVSHDFGFVTHYASSVVCVKQKLAVHATSEIDGRLISQVYGRHVKMVRHDHAYTEVGRT